MKTTRAAGFSLTELMVVLGILAILCAILLPVLGSAKKSAYQTTCLSNVGQISKALLLYASSNDENIPNGSSPFQGNVFWMDAIGLRASRGLDEFREATVQPSIVCPSYRPQTEAQNWLGGYAINECVDGVTDVGEPTKTVLVGESTSYKTTAFSGPLPESRLAAPDVIWYETLPNLLEQPQTMTPIGEWGAERHRGRANYAMLDGHAVALSPDQFRFPVEALPCNGKQKWAGPSDGFTYAIKP